MSVLNFTKDDWPVAEELMKGFMNDPVILGGVWLLGSVLKGL